MYKKSKLNKDYYDLLLSMIGLLTKMNKLIMLNILLKICKVDSIRTFLKNS